MVKISDVSPNKFYSATEQKKIFVFGAGRTSLHCIDIYCMGRKIEAIVDNNSNLWGKKTKYGEQELEVISMKNFIDRLALYSISKVVLLITPIFYAGQILRMLDKIEEIDGLECYLHFLLRNNSDEKNACEFTQGQMKIPKTIHYFWLGGKRIPEKLEKYMDTWKKKCPDYEIICWNESNYDLSKNRYMKEAYESKAWGFVPDYARLDVIYEYGGIYLDTDVELLNSMDKLLCDDAFFGAGGNDQINLGSGFGAKAGNDLIGQLRDYYEGKSFYKKDGSQNLAPCHQYQHPVFKKNGFRIRNEYQKIKGNVIYPAEVLAPTGLNGMGNFFTDNTISIHHTELSWISELERDALRETKEYLKRRFS